MANVIFVIVSVVLVSFCAKVSRISNGGDYWLF
jgi:hypothetical protein